MPPKFDIAETKRSVGAHKGHLTRIIDSCDKAADFLLVLGYPNAAAIKDAEESLARLKKKCDEIEEKYDLLSRHDPENESGYQSAMSDVFKVVEETKRTLLTALADIQKPRGAAAAAGAAAANPNPAGRTFKFQSGLLPERLNSDADPVMLRSFLQDFQSFYNLSNMSVLPIPDQQGICLKSLDSELREAIRPMIDDYTEIFGDASCANFLTEKFKNLYPLF